MFILMVMQMFTPDYGELSKIAAFKTLPECKHAIEKIITKSPYLNKDDYQCVQDNPDLYGAGPNPVPEYVEPPKPKPTPKK